MTAALATGFTLELAARIARSAERLTTPAEAQIRHLLAARNRTIGEKYVDAIVAHYAPDAVICDVKRSDQLIEAQDFRRAWEECLVCFENEFEIETRDLRVDVHSGGDRATVQCFFRITGLPEGDPAMDSWHRNTTVWRRDAARWRIVREECSLPFRPRSATPVFMLEL